MVDTTLLEQEIAKELAIIDGLERNLEIAKAKVCAYKKSLELIGGSKTKRVKLLQDPIAKPATRSRQLSDIWLNILRFIGDDIKTIDDVEEFGKARGIELKRSNIRSQIANLVNNHGYLQKHGTGQFSLTEAGVKACGYSKQD